MYSIDKLINIALCRFFSVVLAKYDVTQRGPNAITVSEEITSASMMQCLNDEVRISVPVRVKEGVKSGLQMTQLPLILSVVGLFLAQHQVPKKCCYHRYLVTL